jgi:hypothetical protein
MTYRLTTCHMLERVGSFTWKEALEETLEWLCLRHCHILSEPCVHWLRQGHIWALQNILRITTPFPMHIDILNNCESFDAVRDEL